ncbi:MAG: hypothetical protein GX638_15040 [Crenarchaeota archaeon]|nr:hypothetical protein [Thermoproteota archaeon]
MDFDREKVVNFYTEVLDKLMETYAFQDFAADPDSDFFADVEDEVLDNNTENLQFFSGISKGVIYAPGMPQYVIKIPFLSNWGEDYCRIEVAMYQEAKKENLERFFAASDFLMYYGADKLPVYIMEYMRVNGVYIDRSGKQILTQKSEDVGEVKSLDFGSDEPPTGRSTGKCIHYLTEAYLSSILPEDDFKELVDFLEELSINDIHSNNVGFREDHSVGLIDYSGI